MEDFAGSSSPAPNSKDDKTVVVRVKRKEYQSRLDAFWLEINERPLKRPLLDFQNLSISESTTREKIEVRRKRFFVQHVETVRNTEITFDVLQSYVPDPSEPVSNTRSEERRHAFRRETHKQQQLLSKAKEKQEVLAKSARFEQIWRRRKGGEESEHDQALADVCDLYDVVRVEVEETSKDKKIQEDMSLEDQMLVSKYLPLMREHLPSVAEDLEADIHAYTSSSADDYVYDVYTVKGDLDTVEEDPSNPFPSVQVDNDDDIFDGLSDSEYDTDDSNAENNPCNDYPEEESESGLESKSTSSESQSERESAGSESTNTDAESGVISTDTDAETADISRLNLSDADQPYGDVDDWNDCYAYDDGYDDGCDDGCDDGYDDGDFDD